MIMSLVVITATLIGIFFVMKECGCLIGTIISGIVCLLWFYVLAGKLGLL